MSIGDAIDGTYAPIVTNVPQSVDLSNSSVATQLTPGFYLLMSDIDFNMICGSSGSTACNSSCWTVYSKSVFPLMVTSSKPYLVCHSESTGSVKVLRQPQS